VVVFLTTIVTCRSPHRSATAASPVKLLLAVTTFVFAVALTVVAAHAFAFGSASASAARPAASAVRMFVLLLSGEGETFDVDVAARNARGQQVATDDVRHGRRPAEKDVAICDIGNELAQVLGRQQACPVAAVVTDDVVDDKAAACRKLV